MIQYRLWFELERVAARYRLLRFWQALAAGWLMAALVALVFWRAGLAAADARLTVALLCAVAAGLVGLFLRHVLRMPPRYDWVAHQIEHQFPELRTCLLAAMEQRPDLPDGRFGFLQSSVIAQALAHADSHAWPEVIPSRRIAVAIAAQFTALVLFLLALAAAVFWVAPPAAAARGSSSSPAPGSGFSFAVEPGDAEIERGTSLLVLARVKGEVPPEAALLVEPESGESARLEMTRSLADPVFGGRVAAVKEPLAYRVEMGGQTSPTYRVTVFEYPRLERADARLVFPSYTRMEERLVQDVHTISVVEGTELTLVCHLNKPVVSAALNEPDAESVVLSRSPAGPTAYQATIRCQRSRRLTLALVDEAGRRNVQNWDFVIRVLTNQPPTVKPIFPARDMEVSPLEEIDIRATVWDDFGLARYGITYSMAGQRPVDVTLAENAAGRERHDVAHVLRLEDLQAEPDQLLAYYLWAEDFGPDGHIRRTQGDMYFAEVRPFEEIYRQGEQPAAGQQQQGRQGQGQNAQAAEQLAQLQKEIINATWKLIRRETAMQPTAAFAGDVEQVHISQTSALAQATSLAKRLMDPQSQAHAADVLEAMKNAAAELHKAHEAPSAAPLTPALAFEQAAYQGLLKLRAREHQVIRQQRQRSSSASSSPARSQQQRMQMQQLELERDENRYETQRMAQSPQDETQERENRQVLNRLRELARRQHDLNERLKELQSALAEAQTPEEREEVRRQLMRLQEEQRQILRDTDELQSRMESPENQERMSQERQQLEETRDQVRRASEALEQEMVTQAAASGSRAEREFEELRDEFRRRASNRFSEEMRQMRETARQLDERQQDIGRRLEEASEPAKTRSLRDTDERDRLADDLGQQRQRLANLTEQMRQMIQDAEQVEPLLAERLYDTIRESQNQNLDRALEGARSSVRRGLLLEAQQQEEEARRGIGGLREGVERAAEGVLGDETEALRRAREELENLAREVNREIERNGPPQRPRPGRPQEDQAGQPREGQPRGKRGQRQGEQGQKAGEKGQPQGGKGEPREDQQDNPGQRGREQQPSQQPGRPDSQGRQPGQRQSQDGQPQIGQPQRGQVQQGQPQDGQRQSGQAQDGQPQDGQPPMSPPQTGRDAQRRTARRLGEPAGRGAPGPFEDYVPRDYSPLTGDDFRDWSDRLRDVEEMVGDPELRAEAARIRERARNLRLEARRHSAPPNWELVQVQVAGPLVELRDRVAQELLRRTSKQAIVPLDRDPVPPRYSEKTRRYYERLGSGK